MISFFIIGHAELERWALHECTRAHVACLGAAHSGTHKAHAYCMGMACENRGLRREEGRREFVRSRILGMATWGCSFSRIPLASEVGKFDMICVVAFRD